MIASEKIFFLFLRLKHTILFIILLVNVLVFVTLFLVHDDLFRPENQKLEKTDK